MSDSYETAHDIEARLNRLCDDGINEVTDGQIDSVDEASVSEDCESLMADPNVTQHIVRSSKTESSFIIDTLTGSFRCRFEPTQTLYVLHVPIYPPMEKAPEVEAICDRDSVVTKTTQAKRFGMRIELKRSSDSTQSETVLIEVTATSQC